MEPKQLPREFTHTTKKRFVSMASPGPTMPSHQPSVDRRGRRPHAPGGDRPVKSRIGVVARRVELAPGLVGDARAVQRAAAPHRERIGKRAQSAVRP